MPAGKSPSEPSMEEIIASIGRILADDKSGPERSVGAAVPMETAAAPEKDDILELTQVVEEDGSMRHVSPWAGDATPSMRKADPPSASPADTTGRTELRPSHADPVPEPKFGSGGG